MERKRTNKAYVDEENQRVSIDADPEEIARRKFANAKTPDPLKRKKRPPPESSGNDGTE